MNEKSQIEVTEEMLQSKIYFIRNQKVMFDRDLAQLYGVDVKALNRAVKRNSKRFPTDFMFQLVRSETEEYSRYQIGTLNRGKNIKYLPYAFTEQGVAMLSSVLRSDKAIDVNIQIMRMFSKLRQIVLTTEHLKNKVEELEKAQRANGFRNKYCRLSNLCVLTSFR